MLSKNIFKLLFNLETMVGSDLLLVLDSNHAVKFSIIRADLRYQRLTELANNK